uniref:uncharacterized protein LOC105352493 n=1 Tax=Fragaria vesca subsp. vesca TaxID=101020 RepID=UPI0005C9B6B3|nr:PREDICTED: uncharacterized protein LOC105352493 [Fragaria vesca subsp. vesca]
MASREIAIIGMGFVFFLVVVPLTSKALSGGHRRQHINAYGDDPGYDLVLFVLQVTNPRDKENGPYLTIFGLWAEYLQNGAPPETGYVIYRGYTDCLENSHITFSYGMLQPYLRKRLHVIWPTRRDGSYPTDRAFWLHEVDKHGTCMADIFGRGEQYLQKAKELYEQIGIGQFLGRNGRWLPKIEFNTADLLGAIGTERRPLLECEGNHLVRILFCYSKHWVIKPCLPTHPDPARDCPDRISYVLPQQQ